MIGYLEGRIIASDARSVTIQAGPIGYRVYCGPTTLQEWQGEEGTVRVFTYLYVRESIQELFGFRSHEERRFFELLIEVSGVGPRTGQQILDSLSLDVAVSAIQNKKDEVFTRVPGIGSKTAQRIIIDLEPKVKAQGFVSGADLAALEGHEEAIEALMSLGYKKSEARAALKKVPKDIKDAGAQVEEALKLLGK